jgi:hypothetical protein
MLRIGLVVLMALHGVAHLPGVVGSWRLAPLESIPFHTTVLAGRWDVGEGGMQALGVGWLLAAALFWVAAGGALAARGWWMPAAFVAVLLSLVLSVLELPFARVGIWVNALILAALLVGARAGWLSATA